jgi:hypothetical protein
MGTQNLSTLLEKMSPRELMIIGRKLEKLDVPPVLYRYRRAVNWTLKELAVPEIHVAAVDDMNDPFEYRAPLAIDLGTIRKAFIAYAMSELQMEQAEAACQAAAVGDVEIASLRQRIDALREQSGLICFSADPRSNRMWAYYAEGHKGVCIGYSTEFMPFGFAQAVRYVDPVEPIDLIRTLEVDPTILADELSCRKGTEWAFEQEYRVPIGPIPLEHTRLLPIHAPAITEVRLGTRIPDAFRAELLTLVKVYSHKLRVFQMGCDERTFRLTETEIQP